MVYHQDHHRLQCHTCGNTKPAPNTCPECGSSEIQFKIPGTKAVVTSLEKRFPDATIARFDKDNTASERLDRRHHEIVDGSIDILVGTQLLAKGHDLPRLSLVGILLADSELSFPDYSSEERSYQLIHQLAGRVGRGHRAGTVVIQTYNPDSISVKTIGNDGSWLDFYQSQLKERKQFGFPPFYHTLKIEVARAKSTTAETAINSIREFVTQHFSRVEIVGPSPSFIAKRNNVYSWQMIIKAKERSELVSIARSIPIKSTFDIDPLHLL
jgi:primosomal protein N' (replication factor Y)